ncbi:MAG: ABC transporter permease [Actinomycetota bacterium]|nr:ABC transporter permease [Actinomycetota bacterium]
MNTILEAFKDAFFLIVRFNPEFYRVLGLSLVVSGSAAAIGTLLGVPLGVLLSKTNFRGRGFVLSLVHAFMGLPPVVVGLFTFLIIARSGPLGSLELLYTPGAMIIVQVILATPIVAGFTHASMEGVDPRLFLQARSLGASRFQAIILGMREAREGIVAAIIAGFGRVLAEVGAVTIVGGNIRGKTRVMTTDIVLQSRKGDYGLALAEGIILILLAVLVNIFLTRLQSEGVRRESEKRVTGWPA